MQRERESHLLAAVKQWGERGCAERESHLLAAVKQWGERGCAERERVPFAGCCKAVGETGCVVEREREFAG